MKKVLSLFLALMMLAATMAVSGNAYAAAIKYDAQKQQYNSQNCSFNYTAKQSAKLLFDRNSEKYKIYYSKALTNKGKAIASTNTYSGLAFSGKYIYYADTKAGAIMRVKTNGKGKKAIVKFKKNRYDVRFIIAGNNLIYNLIQYKPQSVEIAKTKLYTATLKGTNVKRIAKNVKSNVYFYNDRVYMIKGKNLYYYDFKAGALKTRYVGLDLKGAALAGMENNLLYISYENDTTSIASFYRVDVDKQKYWKCNYVESDAPIHGSLVYEGKVYLIAGTGAGNGFAAVVNDKNDYKTYEKLYDTGGENLGFYKNTIVLDNFAVDKTLGDYDFAQYVIMVKTK